jgi:predicted CxxxxCH...CXXCH cytochrome family protein
MHIDRFSRFAIIVVLAAALSACGTQRSLEEEAALASCAACHGGVDNETGAPPGPLSGDADAPGVGAHTAHVDAGVACDSCHVVPADVREGHPVGRTRAIVTFGGLAVANGAAPQYDPATYTCSSVYCHGTTLDAGGNVHTPTWGQTLPTCNTCHSYPPPSHAGYPERITCSRCHALAVESDDFTLKRPYHLNGDVDFNFVP